MFHHVLLILQLRVLLVFDGMVTRVYSCFLLACASPCEHASNDEPMLLEHNDIVSRTCRPALAVMHSIVARNICALNLGECRRWLVMML